MAQKFIDINNLKKVWEAIDKVYTKVSANYVSETVLNETVNELRSKLVGVVAGDACIDVKESMSGDYKQISLSLNSDNLKTINGQSLIGKGDISIEGGSGDIHVNDAVKAVAAAAPDGTLHLIKTVNGKKTEISTDEQGLHVNQDIVIESKDIPFNLQPAEESATGEHGTWVDNVYEIDGPMHAVISDALDYIESIIPESGGDVDLTDYLTKDEAVETYVNIGYFEDNLSNMAVSEINLTYPEMTLPFFFKDVFGVDAITLDITTPAGEWYDPHVYDPTNTPAIIGAETMEALIVLFAYSPMVTYNFWITWGNYNGRVVKITTSDTGEEMVFKLNDTTAGTMCEFVVNIVNLGQDNEYYTAKIRSVVDADSNNLKTINGQSLIGKGDISIEGGSGDIHVNDAVKAVAAAAPDGTLHLIKTVNGKKTEISTDEQGLHVNQDIVIESKDIPFNLTSDGDSLFGSHGDWVDNIYDVEGSLNVVVCDALDYLQSIIPDPEEYNTLNQNFNEVSNNLNGLMNGSIQITPTTQPYNEIGLDNVTDIDNIALGSTVYIKEDIELDVETEHKTYQWFSENYGEFVYTPSNEGTVEVYGDYTLSNKIFADCICEVNYNSDGAITLSIERDVDGNIVSLYTFNYTGISSTNNKLTKGLYIKTSDGLIKIS